MALLICGAGVKRWGRRFVWRFPAETTVPEGAGTVVSKLSDLLYLKCFIFLDVMKSCPSPLKAIVLHC